MKTNSYSKREKNWPIFLATALIMPLFLFCMNDYNPFEDPLNAKAIFVSGPSDGDTVQIFSSDTFTIAPLVSSYLESFSIEADSNRFNDTTILMSTDPGLNQEKYFYRASFWDTGWHEIRLISVRTGDVQNSARKVIENRRIYAVSPLNPRPVSGSMGDSISLQTDSVSDRNVYYYWDFGGTLIETTRPVSKQILRLSGTGSTGKMWVSDFKKRFSSPKVIFSYLVVDRDGPEILLPDQKDITNDTIVVSQSSFLFRVSIIDRGSNSVNSATVNDSSFDQKQPPLFMKRIDLLDTLKGPLELKVKATDDVSNESQKIFYVIYDTTSNHSVPPRILIESPSKKNTVTALRNYRIFGTLVTTSVDSFTMRISVNDSLYNDRAVIKGADNHWEFKIFLPDTVDSVKLAAYDNRGYKKADTLITMIYDNDLIDTARPVIVSMTIDNNPVISSGTYCERDPDSVRIVTFDEGTGISAVIVNGDTAVNATDTYVWVAKVKSSDVSPGIMNQVKITDMSGNSIDTSFSLIYNSIPVIVKLPSPPFPLLVGKKYIDTILAVDADRDRLFYMKKDGPKGCTVDSSTGLIKWTPTHEDIGTNTLTILIRDKFRFVPYSFQIVVVDSAGLNDPVGFLTQEKEFPALVEADKDTVIDTLKTIAGTGKPPFAFSVRLLPKDTLIRLANRIFKWAPSMSDTGYNQLVIMVTDSFHRSDTIYPVLRVVPPGRVFRLESNDTTLIDSAGVINLNHSTPKTLKVRIIDPYGCDVDNYDVTIKSAGKTFKGAVDSGLVRIILDPEAREEGLDSLIVTVTDVYGNPPQFISVPVFYGSIPKQPQLVSPTNTSVIKNTSVNLSWLCYDDDNDSLLYSVYIAGADTVFTVIDSTPDTSYSLNGLTRAGRYFWKVIADDKKTQIVSGIGMFDIDPPQRVRFKTDASVFPYYLEALKDSLYLAMEVTAGSGYPPFKFSADVSGKSISMVNGSYIKWKPLVSDTGSKIITGKVSDSAGNFDTLKAVIRVVPQNRPCSLFVSGGDTIDMSHLQLDTLKCTVKDPDPIFSEHHTVKIIQRNTEQVEEVDSTRQFSIVINKDSSLRIYDSLTVILSDRAGHTFSVQKMIYYGRPPFSPSNPSPSVGNVLSDSIVNFSWTGGDPDNDDVTYNFYIGTSPDSLIKADSVMNQTSFTDTLNKWGTTYYWKVVATDFRGKTDGPVWSFRLSENLAKVFLNTSVSGANIPQKVTGIPIAVRLDSINTDFSQFDETNNDIRFKRPNGAELPVEIQDWDQVKKTALLWVLVDTVYGNSSTQYLVMYKGNGQNKSGGQVVFGDFSGVWHMSGNGTTESDISGHNNDGIRNNLNQNNIIEGISGKAVQFDLSRYLDMGNDASLQITNRLTIETWIKVSSSASGIEPVVTKGNQSYSLNIDNAQNKFQMTIFSGPGPGGTRTINSDLAYTVDSWYHVAGVFDGFSLNLYVNGVRQTQVNTFGTTISTSSDNFRIGGNASNLNSWLRGALDEVRVSASSRSAEWIKLSYESQRQGSKLLSFVKSHL